MTEDAEIAALMAAMLAHASELITKQQEAIAELRVQLAKLKEPHATRRA